MSVFNPALNKDCPFCHLNLSINTIFDKSEHFWIINNTHPLVKGHIMLITKDHYKDEMGFPLYMYREFTKMSIKAREIVLSRTGIKAMSFVNAPQSFSVHHYHRHFFPSCFKAHDVDNALRLAFKSQRGGILYRLFKKRSF